MENKGVLKREKWSATFADSVKGYFENVHKTTVLAFQQLMIEIDKNLKNHINTFHSDVDTSEKSKVDKHYLEEVKEAIEIPFESLVETMEFGMSETRNIPGPGTPDVNAVQLVPTNKTFEIIERWESIQREYPHIDFPEEAFLTQNWYEVDVALDEIKDKYGKDATDYILDEILEINDRNTDDEESIKDLEKRELDRIFGK